MAVPVNEIHANDTGTVFNLTVKEMPPGATNPEDAVVVDVSDATSITVVLTNPNGVKTTGAGSFATDGTDGGVRYVTGSGTLDKDGRWRLQVLVVTPEGSWSSNVVAFQVVGNL